MKFLLLAGVIVLVLMWLQRPKQSELSGGRAQRGQLANEPILPCTECGLHAPSSEMLFDGAGRAYCCEEHRRLHATR
jgi:uncharacterized protein